MTHLLKLMAIAVKNGRDYKAFELAKMMPSQNSLEMAARYASKSGRVILATKINDLLRDGNEVCWLFVLVTMATGYFGYEVTPREGRPATRV